MPKGWLRNTSVPGRTSRPRVLTNNPQRGSSNWSGYLGMGYAKRGIRRLMKVDPAGATSANNVGAQGTPDNQTLVGVHGVEGRSGAKGANVTGHTESRRTSFGTGKKVISNRGINRSLKKR